MGLLVIGLWPLDCSPANEAWWLKDVRRLHNSNILKYVQNWYHKVYNLRYNIALRYFNVAGASDRLGDAPVVISSSKRAREELSWVPQYNTLECIIESAWKWHRNHPNGYR